MAETTKQQSLVFPFLLAVLVGIAYFEVRTSLEPTPSVAIGAATTSEEKPKPQQIVLQRDDDNGVKVQLTESIQLHLVAPKPKVEAAPVEVPHTRDAMYVPPQQYQQPRQQKREPPWKPADALLYETPEQYLLRKYQEAYEKKQQEEVW